MKLYFASQPQWDQYILDVKHKYILLSYFHLLSKVKNGTDFKEYFKKFTDAGMEIMIDSGAHTLQKNKGTPPDYQSFFDGYLKWLQANIDYIDHYVELDIENVVGLEKVNSWSDTLTSTLKKPPIRVWHRWRGGVDVWEAMTEQYDYIGFSGFLINQGAGAELPLNQIPYYLKAASVNKCKVHGFGFTSPKLLTCFPFHSVDSTSWMAGQRYGVVSHFDGRFLRTHTKEQIAVQDRNTRHLNWRKGLPYNALQWKLFADYLERMMP